MAAAGAAMAVADGSRARPACIRSTRHRCSGRQTLGEYLRALRVRHAANLLRTDMPPAKAAAAPGFADQAHFTRVFGDVVGMTPNAFGRLLRPRRAAES